MSKSHRDDHPRELDGVVRRLRNERPEVSPLELDGIKRRVMAQASQTQGGLRVRNLVTLWRARFVTLALTLGLIASGGTAGVIAGGNGDDNDADEGQYCPPKNGDNDDGDSDSDSDSDCPDDDGDSDSDSD